MLARLCRIERIPAPNVAGRLYSRIVCVSGNGGAYNSVVVFNLQMGSVKIFRNAGCNGLKL